MTFWKLGYHRDSKWNFRVLGASLLWGNTQDLAAGNERERDTASAVAKRLSYFIILWRASRVPALRRFSRLPLRPLPDDAALRRRIRPPRRVRLRLRRVQLRDVALLERPEERRERATISLGSRAEGGSELRAEALTESTGARGVDLDSLAGTRA